jgi:cephalosporin-C deacetylase-like acetyl esterase
MKNIYYLIFSFILFVACNSQVKRVDAFVSQTYSEDWKFQAGIGDTVLWASSDFDDSGWTTVSGNQFLSRQEAKLEDGYGWYRKTVQISDSLLGAIQATGAGIIHLGRLGGSDELYLNGKVVGKTGEFPAKGFRADARNYFVEPADFAAGDNQLAIKINSENPFFGGFMDTTNLSITSSLTKDKLAIDVTLADEDYIFFTPDPFEISIDIQNKNLWPVAGYAIVDLTTDDFQPIQRDSVTISIKANASSSTPFKSGTVAPGFYRYTVSFYEGESGEWVGEKKFNVGFEPEKIESPVDNHPDFKEFWDNSLAELKKIAPQYKMTLVPESSNLDNNIYLVEMRSLGNELIRGYYAQPKKEGKHPVIIEYMGYGSTPYIPTQTFDGFAYFVLSIRGQALNLTPPRESWDTKGLQSKETYYYRGAFCDVVRAIDFVASRPEIDADKIAARGGSQGGALTFVAAALDKRIKAAAPDVPFLSDYPDYFRIVNWPRSDFDVYLQQHPEANWDEIYSLLTYFDVKNLAQWIECPVIMRIGMQDETCPPHTNFAGYNQVKSADKRWIAYAKQGHDVGNAFDPESRAFIKKHLNITE